MICKITRTTTMDVEADTCEQAIEIARHAMYQNRATKDLHCKNRQNKWEANENKWKK